MESAYGVKSISPSYDVSSPSVMFAAASPLIIVLSADKRAVSFTSSVVTALLISMAVPVSAACTVIPSI